VDRGCRFVKRGSAGELDGVEMSLINQVLKDLDKRGADTNIGEATIRVVHGHSSKSAVWLVIAGAVGMLLLGSSAMMLWRSQQAPVLPPVAVMPVPDAIEATSPVIVLPAISSTPKIFSVSPDPLLALASPQTVILNGVNFKEGASVTLKDEAGQVYANRPIISMTQEQITLKLNLGKKSATWWIEVQNTDQTSTGQYAFAIKAAGNVQAAKPLIPAITPDNMAKEKGLVSVGKLPTMLADGTVNKQPTQTTLQQQAENEFRSAYQLMRQGRNTEALAGYEAALQLDAGHEQARQSLVTLLLEKKRIADAETVLQEGLKNNPQQVNFAMLLARLQVERNALQMALETLLRTLPYAEKQPNYLSFVAALMQRQNRHKEAIDYYQKALQLKPNLGVWLMGLGISLRVEQRKEEARDAFKQALETNTLSAELHSYVTQQLKELQPAAELKN
jgi:MSHA biogenesis protein MshN